MKLGNCPNLKDAVLNSIPGQKVLNLNGCINLETLNLGNWNELQSVTMDKCERMEKILAYTNPNLKTWDLSKNISLTTFESNDGGLEELLLPKSIVNVICRKNNLKNIALEDYKNLAVFDCMDNKQLSSLNLTGCEKLYTLKFSNTQIESFNFSGLTNLSVTDCSNTKITALDVSANTSLSNLYCDSLGLTNLDVTNNTLMRTLSCAGNELSALDVTKNIALRQLNISDNNFEKDALETIFTELTVFNVYTLSTKSNLPKPLPSEIKFTGNPGTETCDTKIITDKGWVIRER